jgi:hypothetical protein
LDGLKVGLDRSDGFSNDFQSRNALGCHGARLEDVDSNLLGGFDNRFDLHSESTTNIDGSSALSV